MKSIIDREKYLIGLVYGIIPELIILLIVAIVWIFTRRSLTTYPVDLITFGYGGLLLTIAGCIGPGRYQKKYDLLIYQPEAGSSYSEEIPVSGFVVDDSITKANIMVNGQKAGELEFNQDGIGTTSIKRSDFISSVLNNIYLEVNGTKSNATDFTLFEYTEDMSEEEIDDLYKMEQSKPSKPIEEAKESYIKRLSNNMSSLTLGLLTLGILNLLFAVIKDYMISII